MQVSSVRFGVWSRSDAPGFQLSSHGLLMLNLSGAKYGQFALTYVRDVLNRLLVEPGHGFAIVFWFSGFWSCPILPPQ